MGEVMELDKIEKTLEEKFTRELSDAKKRHIIFWYDENKEFAEDIEELNLNNAKLWKLTGNNNFETKYQLEVVDQQSNYLIYSDKPEPAKRENWLLDIQKYSDIFTANRTTLIMQEFGVEDYSLRYIFKKYEKFFDNKKRRERLKKYKLNDYREENFDIAIISALSMLRMPSLENAVKKILMEGLNEEDNRYFVDIKKFGNEDSFWRLIEDNYGYIAQDKSLKGLMRFLITTNLHHNLKEDFPKEWEGYVAERENNCIVFLDHWMSHSNHAKSYDNLSREIAQEINLKEYIFNWKVGNYLDCDSFEDFDLAIIDRLKANLLDDLDEFDRYQEIIIARRTKHWYEKFEEVYEAIYQAIELFKSQKKYNKIIRQENSYDFFNTYLEEYYLIDKAYRKFYLAYDKMEDKELIINLKDKAENLYTNWYLQELSTKWSNVIEEELIDNWQIAGIKQQKDFYREFIKETVEDGERVYVVISDALRYEAAAEFSQLLNAEVKGATELYAMQGTLPSYTKLGMASLLPHQKLDINDKGEVIVDGINSQGLKNRDKILKVTEEESVALRYEDIVQMSRSDLRDVVKGTKLVYIYHNKIDAKGDHAATELEVFEAIEESYEELDLIVRTLKHGLSAANIYITADHGFIYRRRPLEESDKTDSVKIDAIEEKRRFIISKDKANIEGTLKVNLDYIFGDKSGLTAIVPRGVNRFKKQGAGQNYVHGGASLQEIAIPVIKFKNDRSQNSENEVRKVDIRLTSISKKITNNIFYLNFFQSEKIKDKLIPRRVRLYFEDESGNRISNENIIIADSNSESSKERSFKEKFTLQDLDYQRDKDYYLVLVDEEDNQVYEKINFRISLL